MKNHTKHLICGGAIGTVMFLGCVGLQAQTLISHWDMNNLPAVSGTYLNSVGGGPSMVWDTASVAPATFDPNETRLETGGWPHTRLAASSSALNLSTFSFSLIMDPTDMWDYGTIMTKETSYNGPNAWENIGWELQHISGGNIELAIRGNGGGWFGAGSVLGADSGMPAGGDFADPATYFQIAGGYDATTGNGYLYVTALGTGTLGTFTPIGSLVGGAVSFTPGAVFDNDILSIGNKMIPSGFDGNGAGYDLADLQIYDSLLSESQILFIANNPGVVVPEPASAALLILGSLVLIKVRRRDA